jgi:hypothetical protein
VYTGFWWGNRRERDRLEDPGMDWRIMLRWIFRGGMERMDRINLPQDNDRWWAVVNAVMKLRVL